MGAGDCTYAEAPGLWKSAMLCKALCWKKPTKMEMFCWTGIFLTDWATTVLSKLRVATATVLKPYSALGCLCNFFVCAGFTVKKIYIFEESCG